MPIPRTIRRSDTTPSLQLTISGSGDRPVLLLHGVSRNATDWFPVWDDLAPLGTLIAVDHRGHGGSDRADRYLVADYADDICRLITSEFREPVRIIGHSLGAMVAAIVAAECGDRVSAVVLEDPPFHTMGRDIVGSAYAAQFAGMRDVTAQSASISASVAVIPDALAEIRLPIPGGTSVRFGDIRDRMSLEYLAECLQQVDPAVFDPLATGHWLDGIDVNGLWRRIYAPTLLLQGDPSCGGTLRDADVNLALNDSRDCRVVRFPGFGHQLHRTAGPTFLNAVRSAWRQSTIP